MMQKSVVIFTDGACSGNPGPGGWGSVVWMPDDTVHELGDGVRETTNNRMEMAAAIHALKMLELTEPTQILLYTDSQYLIRGITQWIFGWRAKGWKNAEGKDVANREHWEELLRQVTRLKPNTIQWKYVRGHSGYPGNERCDQIAVSYAQGKPDRLYIGPKDGYFVDLEQLPADEPLPEKSVSKSKSASGTTSSGSSKSSGGGPVSYLSYINGVLKRYSTWAECEKAVKGRPGVKFKKVKSRQEEQETLTSWGLSTSAPIE
ncbi:MAG: ribonuclease HI [Candidatus Melainabacteria bacterium]|nr:MAG: ribonuclease HI [Candidatus Melainabacteria bacterium]